MPGQIVTISQQKGGTGKTTIAAHLAIAWSQMKASVAILDVDPQGSLGQWFEARERRLGEERAGLAFRTASGWGARREATWLARDHDFVIVDTPPKAEIESRTAMESADLVVVPVQPTPMDLWATEATLKMAAGEDAPAVMVLNRVPPRARLTDEMGVVMNDLGGTAAQAKLGNRVVFASSVGLGSTALEKQSKGAAAEGNAFSGQGTHENDRWVTPPCDQ